MRSGEPDWLTVDSWRPLETATRPVFQLLRKMSPLPRRPIAVLVSVLGDRCSPRPERSNYFDVGADRTVLPGWAIGGDLYLKLATDYIDDGEFGKAPVLSQLNYSRAVSQGAEFKTRYVSGGFSACGNVSTNRSKVTRPSSNNTCSMPTNTP